MRKKLVITILALLLAVVTTLNMAEFHSSRRQVIVFIIWFIVIAFITFIFKDFPKLKATDSFEELKKNPLDYDEKITGYYNAHFISGGNFSFFSIGGSDPAVLGFNEDSIILTIGDSNQKHDQLRFKKNESQVIWVGDSGRSRDYDTWLKIKDSQKECLVSIFSGQPNLQSYVAVSKQCAADFYSKISDLGYKTEIEAKRRGLIKFILADLLMLIAIIFTISIHNWLATVMLSLLFVYSVVKFIFNKKEPNTRS